MRRTLQHSVTTGRITLPAVAVVCLLNWLLIPLISGNMPVAGQTGLYSLTEHLNLPEIGPTARYIAGLAVYALMAYLLTVFNKEFALVRLRATVQTALFLLFVTACPMAYPASNETATACCFLLSLFFLFRSYQQQEPLQLFYSFVLLGMCAILLPQLIWLTPLWLLGASHFQALNPRSFSAALSGLLLPFWFLFGHAYFYDNLPLFTGCIHEMVHLVPIDYQNDFPAWTKAATLYLGVLTIISSVHCIAYSYEDKIQTRAYLNFLILLDACLLVFMLLQPIHSHALFIMLAQTASILTAHFFIQTNTRTSNLLFIGAAVCLFLLFVFNLWTLS